jgi:hypothetical protein
MGSETLHTVLVIRKNLQTSGKRQSEGSKSSFLT